MVIAFRITAIKVLMDRLFSTVIMYKIIKQLWGAIIGDAFNQVYVQIRQTAIAKEKTNQGGRQYREVYFKYRSTNASRFVAYVSLERSSLDAFQDD